MISGVTEEPSSNTGTVISGAAPQYDLSKDNLCEARPSLRSAAVLPCPHPHLADIGDNLNSSFPHPAAAAAAAYFIIIIIIIITVNIIIITIIISTISIISTIIIVIIIAVTISHNGSSTRCARATRGHGAQPFAEGFAAPRVL